MADQIITEEPTENGALVRDKFGDLYERTGPDPKFPWVFKRQTGGFGSCRWQTINDRAPVTRVG